MTPVTVTHENWSQLLADAAGKRGANLTIYEACCVYYNLCAPSVITRFSLMLWNLWRRLDGSKGCSYEEYWHLPAIYIEACHIIEGEITTIQNRQKPEPIAKDMLKKNRIR